METLTKDISLEGLTKKDRFCLLYAVQPLMYRVCERVGVTPGMGYKWLAMQSVQKKIETIKANSAQKCDLELSEVLNMALRIADFDIKQVIKDVKHDPETNYYLITYEDWEKIDGRVIKEVKPIVRDGIQLLEIKLYDKTPYIKMLLDHFKEVKPDQHLHVHLTDTEIRSADAQTAAEEYQKLLGS